MLSIAEILVIELIALPIYVWFDIKFWHPKEWENNTKTHQIWIVPKNEIWKNYLARSTMELIMLNIGIMIGIIAR